MLCLVPLLNVNPFEALLTQGMGETTLVADKLTEATNTATGINAFNGINMVFYPKSYRLKNTKINDTPSIVGFENHYMVETGQFRKAK